MPDLTSLKPELRQQLRARRRSLTAQQHELAATALAEQVAGLPQWQRAQRIALYLDADGEIATRALTELARREGKQIYLPVVRSEEDMVFALWDTDCVLQKNRYDIPEPDVTAQRCAAALLDILFLPLVAWDLHGTRLGMGGGFYDRALEGVTGPLLVGLAFDFQQQAALPREEWDVPVDFVATETTLYPCQVK